MNPQNPDDPAHPKVSGRLASKTPPETQQKFSAGSGALRKFLDASDTSAFDISVLLPGYFILRLVTLANNLGTSYVNVSRLSPP